MPGTRPYLFWAAIQLTKPDDQGQQHAVLISITQNINGYARDFLKFLDVWQENMPQFFQAPVEGSPKWEMWNNCLKSCKDYFTDQSREYRLLQKGIIVHHGKMPGLLARLLIELIQEQVIHLVLATSTLTDGVNLPFETILIPSLQRSGRLINVREFSNLIGRAGRPGFGTEGRSLVLLSHNSKKENRHYTELIRSLAAKKGVNEKQSSNAKSPLAELLIHLQEQFQAVTGDTDEDEFLNWLEKTAPLNFDELSENIDLIKTLDSLDTILLSAIVELEQVNQNELSVDELEEKLRKLWERSFARYAYQEQARLSRLFLHRGIALQTQVYPQSRFRTRLYRASLPPRSGNQLLQTYPNIIKQLKTGFEYSRWDEFEQFNYITSIVGLVGVLPKFRINKPEAEWVNLLRWWFDIFWGTTPPKIDHLSRWHDEVSKNFGYRFNWGLGSIISLVMEETFGDLPPRLDDWPQTGLPWVAFWLKELIVWGTLDPVAAYLLSQRIEITRGDAQDTAKQYYNEQPADRKPDELLNVVSIRSWVENLVTKKQSQPYGPPQPIQIDLHGDFSKASKRQWRVVPVEADEKLYWFDVTGTPLASCYNFDGWRSSYLDTHDFVLDTAKKVVSSQPYI